MSIRFHQFEVASFDCYGTLIDWESGILSALRPVLARHGASPSDDAILERYAEVESELEAGAYLPYADILVQAVQRVGARFGVTVGEGDQRCLVDGIGTWPAFPDTVDSLTRLARRYRLAVISNVDDDLFDHTARQLHVPFSVVVTAQQAGAYKPDSRVFEYAVRVFGVPRERILHIAQSSFHDVAPARAFGLTTVWVNRRHGKPGFGATAPSRAKPHLEVRSLAELADRAGA